MKQAFADVLEFHRKFEHPVGEKPAEPDEKTIELRDALIYEEYMELNEAMMDGDLPKVADALADLIYVAIGTAIVYGIDLRPVWEAVQASNMAKEGGGKNELGKSLKPPGWRPPDIAGLLAKQGRIDTPDE